MNKKYAQYLQERNRKSYDEIADNFSRTRSIARKELKKFNRFVKRGDFLLDLGCGNGQLIDALQEKEVNYIGIDSSPRLVKIAQQKHPSHRFIAGDILKTTFPTETFDGVFAIALLHHIPSFSLQLNVLQEATRVLKPNGFLFITVWQMSLPLSRLTRPSFLRRQLSPKSSLGKRDFIHQWGNQANLYYHIFTQRELKKLIREAKLNLIDSGKMLNASGDQKNIYLIARK